MATMKGKRVITSIYLDPLKYQAMKRLSAASGRPVAEHLREAVDDILVKYKVHVPRLRVARSAQ